MTLRPSRRNTLKSLRKRDLADALKNLKKSEEDLLKISENLLLLQGQIASVQDQLDSISVGSRDVLAGDLEAEMSKLDRLAKGREELVRRKAKADEVKETISSLVDNLRDEVAKAKRALLAVEDERT